MIARIAYSDPVDAETAATQKENFVQRFKPVLAKQPGLLGGFWLEDETGRHVSLTFWESKQAMEEGGRDASATPLIEGMRQEQLPKHTSIDVFEVIDRIEMTGVRS
ncbi:MAG TPA: antibiotic biosynthesis monooxygenase [Candidatus Dormibacteraeota bacterium]|nr:antibiotic biosynthesis monooxygenase [Candidatus Dormibacteraeota bacterium]